MKSSVLYSEIANGKKKKLSLTDSEIKKLTENSKSRIEQASKVRILRFHLVANQLIKNGEISTVLKNQYDLKQPCSAKRQYPQCVANAPF